MKGNKKVLVIAVLLLLISVSFTTYAIYRNSWTGNGTINAAKWTVKLKKGGSEVQNANFGASDITWTKLTGYNNTIAPGSEGTITYTVDASGSEVDVLVSAAIDTEHANLPEGFSITGVSAPETIAYATGEGNMVATITVSVAWAGADSDNTTKDEDDMSFEGESLSIPMTITAKQSVASHS